MFFEISNNSRCSIEYLRTSTLMKAYYIVKKYPMNATELLLESYIKQQYSVDLKNMCIKLLLNMQFCANNENNLIFIVRV